MFINEVAVYKRVFVLIVLKQDERRPHSMNDNHKRVARHLMKTGYIFSKRCVGIVYKRLND